MNIESVLKTKELMDAQAREADARTLAWRLECELHFEECRAVLNELAPKLKMRNLTIGSTGFHYRAHETLRDVTSYLVTIHNGEVAYCKRHSKADSYYFPSKEEFFEEITQILAYYL